MLQRLYVHNFKCLENFELTFKDMPAALLIGKNGVGKSTISQVLEIVQSIGRGTNRISDLVRLTDFAQGRSDVPIRFEIEVLLDDKPYKYVLALELPEKFRELRVFEEHLSVGGNPIYQRRAAQVTLHTGSQNREAQFSLDWHVVALPVIQEHSPKDPLRRFKLWLAHSIILAPIPELMTGKSGIDTLKPIRSASNLGNWLVGILSRYPAAYEQIKQYLTSVMPDFEDFINDDDFGGYVVRFKKNEADVRINFRDLSDGEKCFFLCAVIVAANKFYGPVFCFWDEPDNYLCISEIGFLITALRRSFQKNGQILVTSHNSEVINKFAKENTFVLDRKSHLEPTVVRLLGDLTTSGNVIDALLVGDISV